MSVGRWYPTATELADGRVLTFAGDNIVEDEPLSTGAPSKDASVNSASDGVRPEDEPLDGLLRERS